MSKPTQLINNERNQNQEPNREQRIAGDTDVPLFIGNVIAGIVATVVTATTGISDAAVKALKAGEPFDSMSNQAKELAGKKMSRIHQLTRGTQIIESNIDSIPAKREYNIKRIEANRRELSKLYGEVADIIEKDLSNIRRINPSIVETTKEITGGFREVSKEIINRSFPLDPRDPDSHTQLNQNNSSDERTASQQKSDHVNEQSKKLNNNENLIATMKKMNLNPDNNIHLAAFSYIAILEQGGDPSKFVQQLPSFQSLEPSKQKEFAQDVAKTVKTAMGVGKESSLSM
jgi:hypothetical protein